MPQSDIGRVIVDRIEDGVAVLESAAGTLDVPSSWLPDGAVEGSVLRLEIRRDDGSSHITLALDPGGQAERQDELERLRAAIPEGPGGDITL